MEVECLKAARDLMDFIEAEKSQDVLVKGLAENQNPFREKKAPCALL